jgi:hypothetical protein
MLIRSMQAEKQRQCMPPPMGNEAAVKVLLVNRATVYAQDTVHGRRCELGVAKI